MRADQLLQQRGLARSRSHAAQCIAAGRVSWADGDVWRAVTKASQHLDADTPLRLAPDDTDAYVSRAGFKLRAALDAATLAVSGMTALDVGQSTGGFTDCLLQAGAARVVGVEVGHNQLVAALRHDPRVMCIEGLNARELAPEQVLPHNHGLPFDLVVMDVSFISQTLILPRLPAVMDADGWLVSLIKPQFELSPGALGKGGIVQSAAARQQACERVLESCRGLGFSVQQLLDSPIAGGDGNREFLLVARAPGGIRQTASVS